MAGVKAPNPGRKLTAILGKAKRMGKAPKVANKVAAKLRMPKPKMGGK